jgi:hypothetical protein
VISHESLKTLPRNRRSRFLERSKKSYREFFRLYPKRRRSRLKERKISTKRFASKIPCKMKMVNR